MAKDKDKQANPAAVALKKQKQAALKKSKANLQAQRHEKLARRNPERLQRQIDELKELETAQGGTLRPRDKQQLEQLERDVKAIKKARDERPELAQSRSDGRGERGERGARGGATSDRGRGGSTRGGSSLGKRRRDSNDADASDDTDPDVRSIPMPRDTPPPVPPRPRPQRNQQQQQQQRHSSTNANDTPVLNSRYTAPASPSAAAPVHSDARPKPIAQTTYSSAPQVRNLQKEAVAAFVPAAVAAKLKQRSALRGKGGEGRLLEPEEVERLEREGYLDAEGAAEEAGRERAYELMAGAEGGGAEEAEALRELEEQEAAFQRELAGGAAGGGGDGGGVGSRGTLAEEARQDGRQAAMAEAEEAQHIANAELAGAAPADAAKALNTEGRRAHTQLRLVEVEDLSEDEW